MNDTGAIGVTRRAESVGPLLLVLAVVLTGCDAPSEDFASNTVLRVKLEHQVGVPLEQAADDVSAAVEVYFGGPDEPLVPEGLEALVDREHVRRAAGKVASREDGTHVGLYREHCAVCHGLNGNGRGPAAAMQNPYPRDFRMGIYKFKSTARAARPTRMDLIRALHAGLPGSSMPSFAAVPPEDLEALVDYVIFLSVRGEFERALLTTAALEFDYGEEPLPAAERLFARDADEATRLAQREELDGWLSEIVEAWGEADAAITPVPEVPDYVSRTLVAAADRPTDVEASVERGRALFHGQVANCVGCHGRDGAGGIPTLDYDEWTKDWTTRIGLTPSDPQAIEPFREAGALKPRLAQPRNLQQGAFRGGAAPEDLFRRIVNGIAGTPMPAVTLVETPQTVGLTADQVWDLVNYLYSLSPEPVSAIEHTDLVLPEVST